MIGRQVQVTVERPDERIVLIRVSGTLDRDGAAALVRLTDAQAELARLGRCDLAAVLVDLDGVSTFDAAAFRELGQARARARRDGFALCLTGCGGRVHLLPLPVQQMLSEHRTYPTVEVAVAAHAPRRPTVPQTVDVFPEPRRSIEQVPAVLA